MSNEWKTIDEHMEGKKWGDIKITEGDDDCHWFRPFYRDNNGDWFGLDKVGDSYTYVDGNDPCWKLYEEPIEPLYQWARKGQCNTWIVVDLLMTEKQISEDNNGTQYRKIGGPFRFDSGDGNES